MPTIPIDAVRADVRCQPRVTVNPDLVDEYAEAMVAGADFPPITVYRDGDVYWLADGFHRLAAARRAGLAKVSCDVREGDLRDAILHAVGANATHGVRRGNLDKRRAVETLLKDSEWSQWSNSEIARRCAVHHTFVGRMRESLVLSTSDERTYTDRWGNTATMRTRNIGQRADEPEPEEANVNLDDLVPESDQTHSSDLGSSNPLLKPAKLKSHRCPTCHQLWPH